MRNKYGFKVVTLKEAKEIVKKDPYSNVRDGYRNGTIPNIYNLIAYQENDANRVSYLDVTTGKNYILMELPEGSALYAAKEYRKLIIKELSKDNLYRYLHTIKASRYGRDGFEIISYDLETKNDIKISFRLIKGQVTTEGYIEIERM